MITKLINEVHEGVKNSIFGPPLEKNEEGKLMFNSTNFNVFLTILSSLCPKGTISADMTVNEPKEKWENPDEPR